MESKTISKILYYLYKCQYKFSLDDLLSQFKGDEKTVYFVLDAYFIKKNNLYFLKTKYIIDTLSLKKKYLVIYDRHHPERIQEKNFFISDLVLYDKEKKAIIYLISRKYETIDVKIDKSYHLSFYFDNKAFKNYRLHCDNFKDLKINKVYNAKINRVDGFDVYLSVVELIGSNFDFDIHIKRLIAKAGFKRVFSSDVLLECENLKENDMSKRRIDLKDIYTITLDNHGAKDYDDAISITKDNKYTNLYIHIADVANFVKENSNLDKEAKNRCFSLYPINGVIPMFPEKISNNLCSLNKNEEKLCITTNFKFDKESNLIDYKIFESKILVDENLYYDDFDNPDLEQNVKAVLEDLKTITKKIRKTELFKNHLSFFQTEPRFFFKDKKIYIDTKTKESLASEIIETLMVYTNYYIGLFLKNNNISIPFRTHSKPKDEKLEEIYSSLSFYNLDYDFKDLYKGFRTILKQSMNMPLLERNLISETLLKCQQKAIYSLSDGLHFALGITNYTHFTAPIRRYADLLVHRQLKRFLNKEEQIKKGYLLYLIEIINEKENALIKLERELRKLEAILYMKTMKKKDFEVIISGVIEKGFFINFKEGFSGFVSVKDLKDYYFYDSNNKRLYSDLGIEYNFGDIIFVRYKHSDLEKLFLDFSVSKE